MSFNFVCFYLTEGAFTLVFLYSGTWRQGCILNSKFIFLPPPLLDLYFFQKWNLLKWGVRPTGSNRKIYALLNGGCFYICVFVLWYLREDTFTFVCLCFGTWRRVHLPLCVCALVLDGGCFYLWVFVLWYSKEDTFTFECLCSGTWQRALLPLCVCALVLERGRFYLWVFVLWYLTEDAFTFVCLCSGTWQRALLPEFWLLSSCLQYHRNHSLFSRGKINQFLHHLLRSMFR